MTQLSAPQDRVMQWLGQGHTATCVVGSRVEANGKRLCNLSTIAVLLRLGLVEQISRWHWAATDKGRDYWRNKVNLITQRDASASALFHNRTRS